MAVIENARDEDPTDYRTAQASQVIFTNVEEADSPRRKRGFQTVFLTQPELSWEMVLHEIEPSLQYYPRAGFASIPDAEKPREHVFFTTSTGLIALACISPLLDEMDRFNRPKMLFAHVLLFDADDFAAQFGNDPFLVFEQHHFFPSFAEVSDSGMTRDDGHIDQVKVSVDVDRNRQVSPAFAQLEQDNNQVFLTHLLASRAASPRRRRFSLQFDGPAGSMYSFLRSLFPFLPISLRTAWSFDTLFVGSTGESKQTESPQWANGVEPGQMLKQKNSQVISFNMVTGAFEFAVESFQPESPFESWLVHWMEGFQDVPINQTLQDAFNLQQVCWGRTIPDWAMSTTSPDIFEMFFEANHDYLKRMLTKNLSKYPGGGLEDSLIHSAITWIENEGAEGLRYIPRKLPKIRLCQWLLNKTRNREYRESTEIEAIQQFAMEAINDRDEEYLNVALLLSGTLAVLTQNWGDLVRVIAKMPTGDYQQLARWSLGLCHDTWCQVDVTEKEDDKSFRFIVTCPTRKNQPKKDRFTANCIAALLGILLSDVEVEQGKNTVKRLKKSAAAKKLRKNWPVLFEIIESRNEAERRSSQGMTKGLSKSATGPIDDWMDSFVETQESLNSGVDVITQDDDLDDIRRRIESDIQPHLTNEMWDDIFVPALKDGGLAYFHSTRDSKAWSYQRVIDWMMEAEPTDIDLDRLDDVLVGDEEGTAECIMLECIREFYWGMWYMVADRMYHLTEIQFLKFAKWALTSEFLSQEGLLSRLTWIADITSEGDIEVGVELSSRNKRVVDVTFALFGWTVESVQSMMPDKRRKRENILHSADEIRSKNWQILFGLLESLTRSESNPEHPSIKQELARPSQS